MRERRSWLFPLLMTLVFAPWTVVAFVQELRDDDAWVADWVVPTLVGLAVMLAFVLLATWVQGRSVRRRLAGVRAICPGAFVSVSMIHSGFHVAAAGLGDAMHRQTRRRPTAYAVLAVDPYAVTIWHSLPVEVFGFVPAARIDAVSVGRGRAGLFHQGPALVFSVRVSETTVRDLPVTLVRWSEPLPRNVDAAGLPEAVDEVRRRLAAGRAGTLPPAG